MPKDGEFRVLVNPDARVVDLQEVWPDGSPVGGLMRLQTMYSYKLLVKWDDTAKRWFSKDGRQFREG